MMRHAAVAASVLVLALAACDAGDEAPPPEPGAAEAAAAVAVAAPEAAEAAGDETAEAASAGGPVHLVYPEVRTTDQVDDYNGVEVADPYRWLENDVREDADVATFVADENAVTDAYLDTLPAREPIKRRMHQLWDYERFGLPQPAAGRIFYERNDGLQNQDVLYVKDGDDAEPVEILDPNGWSDDGATALAEYAPSPDGRYVAYTIQDGGSDWRTVKVIAVADDASVTPQDDEVDWVKFSDVVWSTDSDGFFYARYPEPEGGAEFQNLNFNHKVYFHALGETQDQDRLVYERPDHPEHGFGLDVLEGGRHLLVTVWAGTDERYELVLIDLDDEAAAPVTLVSGFDNEYDLVGFVDGVLYLRTNRDAPNGRVVAMDITAPEPANWTEIVPESDDALVFAQLVGGKIIADYLSDAVTKVRLYAVDGAGEIGAVELPGLGVASGFAGHAADAVTYYSYSSLNRPPSLYRLDMATGESSVFAEPELPFNPDDFVVEQVFYPSKDGTQIPMFIAYKRGLAHDGTAPTLLYGYGGFNIPNAPYYRADRLAWMDMGGLYASANLRGGGEYGAAWHDAGRLLNKQNVFDDFAAAAEHLIAERWTSSEHLAIYGRSNGGLLVGATVNQHPELFAAALPQVGVMDMLRFNQFTAGRFWTDDYGDPANPTDFVNLFSYSPYHNIRSGVDYPAIMALTADTDDRVVPGHTFKYIAALQAADTGDAPKIVRIDTRAGHGSGKPVDKQIEEWADMWAFIAAHTGLTLPEGYGAGSGGD